MGGTTITEIGKTEDEALNKLRNRVIEAYNKFQMEPDSDLVTVNHFEKKRSVWRMWIDSKTGECKCSGGRLKGGNLKMLLADSAHYVPKPTTEKPWVATIHLHT
jgi:hypothetical protein